MNYGYAPASADADVPPLESFDEQDRLCIQLYLHAIDHSAVQDKDVLEVGSGPGDAQRNQHSVAASDGAIVSSNAQRTMGRSCVARGRWPAQRRIVSLIACRTFSGRRWCRGHRCVRRSVGPGGHKTGEGQFRRDFERNLREVLLCTESPGGGIGVRRGVAAEFDACTAQGDSTVPNAAATSVSPGEPATQRWMIVRAEALMSVAAPRFLILRR